MGRISLVPEQPRWLYALIFLQQYSPLPRRFYPSENWLSSRCLTSVIVLHMYPKDFDDMFYPGLWSRIPPRCPCRRTWTRPPLSASWRSRSGWRRTCRRGHAFPPQPGSPARSHPGNFQGCHPHPERRGWNGAWIWAQSFIWNKETTLERADFTLQLLMFVTAEKERRMFIIFFLSIFCQLLSPWI